MSFFECILWRVARLVLPSNKHHGFRSHRSPTSPPRFGDNRQCEILFVSCPVFPSCPRDLIIVEPFSSPPPGFIPTHTISLQSTSPMLWSDMCSSPKPGNYPALRIQPLRSPLPPEPSLDSFFLVFLQIISVERR